MLVSAKPPAKELRKVYGEFKTDQNPCKSGLPLLIVKSTHLDSERDFEEQVRVLEERRELRQDSLVELVVLSKKENRGMCSTSFSLLCAYEFHSLNLDVELAHRIQTARCFTSDELLSIISTAVDSLHPARRSPRSPSDRSAACEPPTRVPAAVALAELLPWSQAAGQPRGSQRQVSLLAEVQHLASQSAVSLAELLRTRSQRCAPASLRLAFMVAVAHAVQTSSAWGWSSSSWD